MKPHQTETTTRPRRRSRSGPALLGTLALAALLSACGSSSPASSPGGTSGPSGTSASSSSTSSTTSSSSSASALPGAGKPTIVLGDKNFEEEYLLGYLYADAFKAEGYHVVLKPNIGGSSLINRVFQAGKINAYPEYLGEIAATDAGYTKPLTSEAQTYKLAEAYEQAHGATVMKPETPFYDTDELVVLKSFAQAHHLTNVGQLKGLGPMKFCDYPSEENRYEGYLGLKEAYGLTNLQFVPLSTGLQYQALDRHECTVADAFSTDPQLLSGKYTPLADTKHIFGFQHVGLVIKSKLLGELGPEFQTIYAKLTDLLTTSVMQALNKGVVIDKASPQTVADAFLKANGLLGSRS